ncbi:MAG TPA: FAD/NAD(P)-binding oxidoreductase [Candidatus Altiarchaeales archaeon]|nr:FAD/NAD(P)-binding oxidoreductase [Candidatus Altiarchaeales archaeon]
MTRNLDVIIIGGGVVGCSIAWELSKFQSKILLLEKESDVCYGTSGRNSGVAHAGFYVKPRTLKAKTNVKGLRMLPKICEKLGVSYKEIGKLVIAKNEDEIPYLEKLKKQGKENGVKGLSIMEEEDVKRLEPNIKGIAALYSEKSAILDPFKLTIALAENAYENGVNVLLERKVTAISRENGKFSVKTTDGTFNCNMLVNSAGLYSDKIAEMVGIYEYKIYPCKGEYFVLDKSKKNLINHLVYPVPPKDLGGLGVHLTPTVDRNIMIGPSAEYIENRDDTSNTAEVMANLYKEAVEILPMISRRDFIHSFSGIRPKLIPPHSKKPADFVIEESPEVEGFINLIGIESPGLTAAPAIARIVLNIIKKTIKLKPKEKFKPYKRQKERFEYLSNKERSNLINKDVDYGRIICRCEMVTKKEIMDAIQNPLSVKTINGIKMRCRATTGRCQGSFCMPKIVEIMQELYNPRIEEFTLSGKGSELFIGRTKDLRKNDKRGG